MKYVHYFETNEDFASVYNTDGPFSLATSFKVSFEDFGMSGGPFTATYLKTLNDESFPVPEYVYKGAVESGETRFEFYAGTFNVVPLTGRTTSEELNELMGEAYDLYPENTDEGDIARGKYVTERIKGCVFFPAEEEPTETFFDPNSIACITEVGATGEIAGYVEPWVGYSQEAETKNLITGITLNTSMISRNPELFAGTFTYIGERYTYVPGNGVSSNYYPVWTNGKKVIILEVRPGSSIIDYITPDSSIPSVSETYIQETSKSPYRSGCITRQRSGVGNYVSQFLTADTEVNQVSYNKAINRIYLTWDGSSMITYEDSKGNQYTDPEYVIDTALTTTEISRAEVYVNGEYQYTLPDWKNERFIGPGQTSSMSRCLAFARNTNGTLIYGYYVEEKVS